MAAVEDAAAVVISVDADPFRRPSVPSMPPAVRMRSLGWTSSDRGETPRPACLARVASPRHSAGRPARTMPCGVWRGDRFAPGSNAVTESAKETICAVSARRGGTSLGALGMVMLVRDTPSPSWCQRMTRATMRSASISVRTTSPVAATSVPVGSGYSNRSVDVSSSRSRHPGKIRVSQRTPVRPTVAVCTASGAHEASLFAAAGRAERRMDRTPTSIAAVDQRVIAGLPTAFRRWSLCLGRTPFCLGRWGTLPRPAG
jgi:hypothetical protein